jgi:hypothetical protein
VEIEVHNGKEVVEIEGDNRKEVEIEVHNSKEVVKIEGDKGKEVEIEVHNGKEVVEVEGESSFNMWWKRTSQNVVMKLRKK